MRRVIAPTLCVGALAVFSFVANAQNWKTLDAGDAPARLLSLGFADGSVLDATNSRTWGAWTVSIDPQDPAIVERAGLRHKPGKPAYHAVRILGLRCRNKVIGERICVMSFSDPPGWSGD